jgi:hypothetical protein
MNGLLVGFMIPYHLEILGNVGDIGQHPETMASKPVLMG